MDYNTIYEKCEAGFVEKRSEFIGYLAPCADSEQAVAFIEEIRARHRKATHNVYAYILRDGNTTRYSDDGEPQGTAGVPVLNVLQKSGLTDVCCVVTRYFGGILLGGGGLVRAYSHSASLAVSAARIMKMCECREMNITTDYTFYGAISNALHDFEVKLLDTQYSDNVELRLLVKTGELQTLRSKLTDVANGQISLYESEIKFGDFS